MIFNLLALDRKFRISRASRKKNRLSSANIYIIRNFSRITVTGYFQDPCFSQDSFHRSYVNTKASLRFLPDFLPSLLQITEIFRIIAPISLSLCPPLNIQRIPRLRHFFFSSTYFFFYLLKRFNSKFKIFNVRSRENNIRNLILFATEEERAKIFDH